VTVYNNGHKMTSASSALHHGGQHLSGPHAPLPDAGLPKSATSAMEESHKDAGADKGGCCSTKCDCKGGCDCSSACKCCGK